MGKSETHSNEASRVNRAAELAQTVGSSITARAVALREAADAQRRAGESRVGFNRNSVYTVIPPEGVSLKAEYIKHSYWHDDDGQPVACDEKIVDKDNPFVARQEVEVDYETGEVVFKDWGLGRDNHHDTSLSMSGTSAWWELRIGPQKLADCELSERPRK